MKGGRNGESEEGKLRVDNCKLQIGETRRAEAVRKVVVIGASAGGIGALMQVLSHLPPDLPAAVAVVQHLRDDGRSRLPELLTRCCPLRVRLARDGMRLETGMVYVAVPGQHLRIEEGRLFLDLTAPLHHVRPAADVLFVSAAQVFGTGAIGIVLSGTGSDGSRGCQMIREGSGITIAQDERSSRYFGMPGAAIAADAIDYVLPLNEIADKIVALIKTQDLGQAGRSRAAKE